MKTMRDAAPDLIEPFVGWRAWGVSERSGEVWLVSHGDIDWPHHGPLVAECHRGHAAPAPKCTCGIYALAGVEIPYYAYDGDHSYRIFGEVALWGTVVRGTRGYRAECARPVRLFLAYKDFRLAQPLRDAYGVPVRLTDPFALTKATG
jgi:hypothetical protein